MLKKKNHSHRYKHRHKPKKILTLSTNLGKKTSERNLRSMHKASGFNSVQLLSRVQLWDPMDCTTPGLPVHHQLLEFTQTHVHWVSDVTQPSHRLSSPSPPDFYLSQHLGLFKWVSSSHQVAKVLEFQHQSFQWMFRTDFL